MLKPLYIGLICCTGSVVETVSLADGQKLAGKEPCVSLQMFGFNPMHKEEPLMRHNPVKFQKMTPPQGESRWGTGWKAMTVVQARNDHGLDWAIALEIAGS